MADISIDTSELERLAADISQAAGRTEVVSAATLSKIAQQVKTDAVAAAPVDTGALKASIYSRGGKDWRKVGSDLRYAFFVEFGTSDTPPQPFLFPAAARAEADLFDEVRKMADPFG